MIAQKHRKVVGLNLLRIWIMASLLAVHSLAYAAHLKYTISGLKGDSLDNVKTRLTSLRQTFPKIMTVPDIKAFKEAAPDNIKQALQPYGYYRAHVLMTSTYSTKTWHIEFRVEKGLPVRIKQFTLFIKGAGKNLPVFRHFVSPLKKDEIFNIKNYQATLQSLFNTAQNNGFIHAAFTSKQIQINRKKHTAIIILHFSTGKQYFFGQVSFNKITLKESLLRRYIDFKPGEAYNNLNVLKLQDALNSSGYFSEVKIDPQFTDSLHRHIPINIHLTLKKKHSYTAGIGYGTDTAERATFGWHVSHLNSNGHQLATSVQASPTQSIFQTQYIIPGRHPLTEQYSLGVMAYKLNYPTSLAHGVQLTWMYEIKKDKQQHSISFNVLKERYQRDSTGEKFNAFVVYPEFSWKYISVPTIVFPSHGYSVKIIARGGSQFIGSDVNFAQAEIEGKLIHSLYSDNIRLVFHGELGKTAINNIDNLPTSLQLFLGGAQTMRGYTYQDIGEEKNLYYGGAEIQRKIVPKWYAGVFYDAGNVYKSWLKFYKRDAGISLVRTTPLGPIHVSVAYPINSSRRHALSFIKLLKFNFSMEPDL